MIGSGKALRAGSAPDGPSGSPLVHATRNAAIATDAARRRTLTPEAYAPRGDTGTPSWDPPSAPLSSPHANPEGTIACAGQAEGQAPAPNSTGPEVQAGQGGELMSDSVYRVTEVIGTSATSWEEAAKNAVETAAKTLRDLRVGEVVKFDVTIEDGKVTNYRARVNISFKYEA